MERPKLSERFNMRVSVEFNEAAEGAGEDLLLSASDLIRSIAEGWLVSNGYLQQHERTSPTLTRLEPST